MISTSTDSLSISLNSSYQNVTDTKSAGLVNIDSNLSDNSSSDFNLPFFGAAVLVAASTIFPTMTDYAHTHVPSMSKLFNSAYTFQELDNKNLLVGYSLINKSNTQKYLDNHNHLYQFLHNNLSLLKGYSDIGKVGIEYEEMIDENWSTLSIIIYLHDNNDNDDYVNDLEDHIVNEWLDNLPRFISEQITVSFDWE